ncbi:MAG: CHAD domain-containing protein [Burkholderiales bacterium]
MSEALAPPPSTPRELEIKLAGPRDLLERAMRSPILRQRTQGKSGTRVLHSVYFDTPNGALRRQGIGLRLRKQGRKWVQTIKRERAVSAGLHDRDEFESAVSMRWPSFAPLEGSAFQEAFADLELRKLLQPVFTTEFRRSTRMVGLAGALIEVAFDRGHILGAEVAPICELELELKQGEPSALFALATELCSEFPLRLENRSKAQRGYALMKGGAAQPGRAQPASLDPRMTPFEAFAAIVNECLRHLQSNEDGLLASEDPEYVHQARVALRRFRAALSVFRPLVSGSALEPQNAELRKLAQTLGAARDWDVFRLETLPALPAGLTSDAGTQALIAESEGRRKEARDFAQRHVAAPSYTLALLDFASAFYRQSWNSDPETLEARALPLTEFARRVLGKRWRAALKRGAVTGAAQPASLHPLRIELKKLRYGGEFFASLFPKKTTRKFLKLLAEIQDHLGSINDATTVVRLTDTLREDCREPDTREALGAVRGYFAAQARAETLPALKAWKRMKQAQPFWVQGGE